MNRTLLLMLSLLSLPILSIAQEDIRVACVGNSITYGLGLENRMTMSYPAQLDDILGSGFEVRNFGCNICAAQRHSQVPYWSNKLANAITYQPDIVVIMLGSNDTNKNNWFTADLFLEDYAALVRTFSQLNSTPGIVLCIPPPAFIDGFGVRDRILVEEIAPSIRTIAKNHSLELIDFRSLLSHAAEFFPDGIHPNQEAARQIAEHIAAVLVKSTVISSESWAGIKKHFLSCSQSNLDDP